MWSQNTTALYFAQNRSIDSVASFEKSLCLPRKMAILLDFSINGNVLPGFVCGSMGDVRKIARASGHSFTEYSRGYVVWKSRCTGPPPW